MSIIRKPFRYRYSHTALTVTGICIIFLFLTEHSPFLSKLLALTPILVINAHMYWQIFTYQFLHGGFWHLFSNMIGLLLFGTAIEKKIGSSEFLLFYLLTGTLCSLSACISYLLTGYGYVSIIGASGAVFALLYLFAVLFPHATIFIFGIIPMPAPILVIVYGCMEVYDMIFTHDLVAHSVHLSGLFFAWLYIRIRFNIKPMKVWNF